MNEPYSLSPAANNYYSGNNQNSNMHGIDNNIDDNFDPLSKPPLNPLTDNAGSLDLDHNQGSARGIMSNVDPLEESKNKQEANKVENKLTQKE